MTDTNDQTIVSVASILLPVWRYAVGPTSQCLPAVPFFRMSKAEAFFIQAKTEIPRAGVRLYRRRLFRGVEIVLEYNPNAASMVARKEEAK